MKRNFCFLIVSFLFCANLFSQDGTTTILLVRHAEKSAAPADDPVLSPAGEARAELLARMLENSGLSVIYTSQYARTKKTAEPLALRFRVPLQTIDAANTNKLVDTILSKHSGETVLVVGHSNTLPEIAQALGTGKAQEIDDNDYDNLYVVTVTPNRKAKLLRLKFFAAQAEQVCQ